MDPTQRDEGRAGEGLIALGLYAQANEFLAVYRHDVEPLYRADTTAVPPLRMDLWTAWEAQARGADVAVPRRSLAGQAKLDGPLVPRVSRVRPHTALRRVDSFDQRRGPAAS